MQKRIHKELDRVFEASNRHLTSDDIGSLKYLECVIKESMRIMPVVPFVGKAFEFINVILSIFEIIFF